MLEETLEDAEDRMGSSVSVFSDDLDGYRTNQASTSLVSKMQVSVDMGGATDTLLMNQLSMIAVESARTIKIEAFYPEAAAAIVRAIQQSDLGLNPRVDGQTIRLILPELTQERRRELVRLVRRRAEDARVAIRNVRRDAQSMIRDIQNEGEASEDDCKRASKTLQELTDDAVAKVGELLTTKEAQILE